MKKINVFKYLSMAAAVTIMSCSDDDSITDEVEDVVNPERSILVDDYVESYQNVALYPAVTTRIENLTDEDAYEFQEDFVDELVDDGDSVIGYKLGFTGDAPRPFGAPEPVYGRLLKSQEYESGVTLDISETWAAGNAGVELAVYIAKDAKFEVSDFPLSDAELKSLISDIAPLSEFPEIAFQEGNMAINYKDLIAANAGARAFVVGERKKLSELDVEIDEIEIEVFKNGEMTSTGISGDALGSQLEALEFLLRKLAEQDLGVKTGQIIATGSLGSDLPLEPGDYRITYEGLGELTYTLEE